MKARLAFAVAATLGISAAIGAPAGATVEGTLQPTRITFQTAPVGSARSFTYQKIESIASLRGAIGWTGGSPKEKITIERSGTKRYAEARVFSISAMDEWESPQAKSFTSAPFAEILFTVGNGNTAEIPEGTHLTIIAFANGKRMHKPFILEPVWTAQQELSTRYSVDVADGFLAEITAVGTPEQKLTTTKIVPTAANKGVMDRVLIYTSDADGKPVDVDFSIDDIEVAARCTIVGTSGSDTLAGTSGDDVICSLDGDDTVRAGGADDIVYAGRGNDTVFGQAGNDLLLGHAGNDTLNAAAGTDECVGDQGTDTGVGCEFTTRIP